MRAYVKIRHGATVYRGMIRLLAVGPITLRLEYFKANQGVKKEDKKAEEAPASVSLEWALPHQVAEVIPAHSLFPGVLPWSVRASDSVPAR